MATNPPRSTKATASTKRVKVKAEPVDEELQNASKTVVPVQAPYFHAGMVHIQATSNDLLITLMDFRPTRDISTSAIGQIAINEVVAMVGMSPQTAKDLLMVLGDVVSTHEKSYGEIVTTYTKARDDRATKGR